MEAVETLTRENGESLSDEMLEHITKLWNDPNIQKAYLRRNEFQIQDTAE